MNATVSQILNAAADRIERDGWAEHHQMPGVTSSDAIAIEVRDLGLPGVEAAALQDASFNALYEHLAPLSFADWMRDASPQQADAVEALRRAAEQAEAVSRG